MPKIYHKDGLIFFEYQGDKFTVSNNCEFLKALNKIKNISKDIDEQSYFERKMIAYDLLIHARNQQISFQEKKCIRN